VPSVEQVLNRFRSQLGVSEQPPGSNHVLYNDWYFGAGARQPWCASGLSWCFFHEGLPLTASSPKGFAYTPSGADWFKKRVKWLTNNSSEVRPGDVVFFYWPNMGRIAHVGIVEAVRANGDIVSIEMNTDEVGGRTGGKVMRRVRSRATVHAKGGFGRPDYSEPEPGPAPGRRPYPGGTGYTRANSEGRIDENVRFIQEQLNKTNLEPKLVADGDFGARTSKAVIGYKLAIGFKGTDLVGPQTWAKLAEIN